MRFSRLAAVAAVLACSSTLVAQQAAPPQTAQGRGGRGQQTPEQREAAAKEAYDREAATPRPIAALDSVWIARM